VIFRKMVRTAQIISSFIVVERSGVGRSTAG